VVELPGDGEWFVRVRPMAGNDQGRATTFGPFRVDSTPPPAPGLQEILPPPGYSFSLSWSPVTDTSGIIGYDVERKIAGTGFSTVTRTTTLSHLEDQLGNGDYTYRIRAVNGAGTLSLPSNEQKVLVKAPMSNPGKGTFLYGIHANYTSFMKIWDISTPTKYANIDEVPSSIRNEYLGDGYGFEIANTTLTAKTREIVGNERNTLVIAEDLFVWLFDYADYDSGKLTASQRGDAGGLQSAGETYDRKLGICGDLATLYITMLRIAGVPARPVHGYLDNPGAGVGDFHVWVEVWVGVSLRSGDPSDTRDDWMTVDVSGISDDPFDVDALMVYFGIFNPEYLALGLNADYDDSSWNAWAQFGWSINPGMPNPQFVAMGKPKELAYEEKDLYFNPETKKRVLVEQDSDPPQGFTMFFPDVKVVSKKRIDYGVNVNGTEPVNATIRIRYPDADAFAAVLPWQSVIYTIYTNSPTVQKEPGKQYTKLDALGYVIWEDKFS
jgi:transglutaminase-like putative cysteine protease